MSAIAADFFRQSPVVIFPLIALVIFMAVFITVTVRTLTKRAASWDAVSKLPLEDDAPRTREDGDE